MADEADDTRPATVGERVAQWQPNQMVPWHLAFYGVLAITVLAVVPDFDFASWRFGTWMAVASLLVVALAYGVLLMPRGIPMGGTRVQVYLVIMILGVSLAISQDTIASLFLFVGFTHTWALTGSRKLGTLYSAGLAVGVWVALASHLGFGMGIAFGAVVAAVCFAFSCAMGWSISGLVDRAFERSRLAAELANTQRLLAEARWAENLTVERERMAQDIHDTLAQGFTSIVMLAQVARRDVRAGRDEAAANRLDLIEQTARDNLAEARALVAGNAPTVLDEGGLADAIERLARRFEAETGVEVTTALARPMPDPRRDVVLLRACQEALANIRKHAGARRVEITLAEDDGAACLSVADDGRGLPADFAPGIGLESMAVRVRAAGGSATVRQVGDPCGVVVRVELPAPIGKPGVDEAGLRTAGTAPLETQAALDSSTEATS